MYVDMIRLPAPPLGARDFSDGRVAVVEFSDLASVSSLPGLAYMAAWLDRYGGRGMDFLGVHCPSGSYQMDPELPYPVVIDGDGSIRGAFGIQDIPARYVIDKDGLLRFYQVGEEGDFENTELFLQQALREKDSSLDLPDLLPPLRDEDRTGGFTVPVTDPVTFGEDGVVLEEPLRIHYRGAEVYIVAEHPEGAEIIVRPGEVSIPISRPRLYRIIRRDEVVQGDLEISSPTPGVRVYSVQFTSRMPRGIS